MKTAVALSMTAVSLFGMQGVAGAETNPECAPIYDQTLGELGHPSQELQDIIGAYANHEIEVHVQILEHGHPQGITTQGDQGQDQAKAYSSHLVDTCHWANPNTVTVTVSKDPRLFRVEPHGNVTFDGNAEKSAKSKFTDNLKDESSPYEADVVTVLKDITPYEKHDQIPDWMIYSLLGGGALLVLGIASMSRPRRYGRYSNSSSSSSTGYYSSGFFDSGGGGGGFGGDF